MPMEYLDTIAFIQKHILNNIDLEDTFYTPILCMYQKSAYLLIST